MPIRPVLLVLFTALALLTLLAPTTSADHDPDSTDLYTGSNLINYNGATLPIDIALGDTAGAVTAI